MATSDREADRELGAGRQGGRPHRRAPVLHGGRDRAVRRGRVGDPHGAHPGQGRPVVRAARRRVPEFWSQTATNIVAQKYFRGKLNSPERERSVRQMIGRVADTITAWGTKDGYFADGDEAETFRAELTHLLLHQMVAFNSPVWFNVGFEEHPQCSACFILSVEDNMESILDWIRKEGLVFRGGSGLGHQPEQAALLAGAAGQGRLRLRAGVVHARRRRLGRHDQVGRQDAPGGQDGRPERRPPRHRGVHLVQAARGGEGPRAAGGRLRHEPRLPRLGVDPVPERQQLGARHRRVHARGQRRRRLGSHRPHRRLGREDGARPRPDAPDRRGGLEVRRSRHALRHDDERLAHLPGVGADQRLEPVLGVPARRQLGLQPGEPQPDEVPRPARRASSRSSGSSGPSTSSSWPRRSWSRTRATRPRRSPRTRARCASSASASPTWARC